MLLMSSGKHARLRWFVLPSVSPVPAGAGGRRRAPAGAGGRGRCVSTWWPCLVKMVFQPPPIFQPCQDFYGILATNSYRNLDTFCVLKIVSQKRTELQFCHKQSVQKRVASGARDPAYPKHMT